jgi:hypothetical protein
VSEGRGTDAMQLFADQHVLLRPDRVNAEDVLDYFDDTCGWFLTDRVSTMTPRVASEAIVRSLAPDADFRAALSGQNLPVELSLMVRTTVSAMALLGQLHASANWYRIAREWVYDEPATSALGQLESEFFAGARHPQANQT